MLKTIGGAKRARILITLTAVCSMVFALLVAGTSPVRADGEVPTGGNTATLSLDKEVTKSEVEAGNTFDYDLYVQCSSLKTTCNDVELVDQFDPRFTVTVPSHIDNGGVATMVGNKLTVKWDKLADGSQVHVRVGVTVPADGEFNNGEVVKNIADVTASNAAAKHSQADVKININHNLNVTGNIKLNPNAVYAKAPHVQNRVTVATYSVTNDSTRVVPVKTLTIENSDQDFFKFFALKDNNAGMVTKMPSNADRVVVSVLEGGIWKSTTPQVAMVGTELNLPVGVNHENVQGVKYTFTNAAGDDIAKTGKAGEVDLGFVLRATEFGTATEISPSQSIEKLIKVKPAIDGLNVQGQPESKTGAEKNAPIRINPMKVEVGVDHSFVRGSSAWNGTSTSVIAGTTNQNVTSLVKATNNSGFAIENLTIETPYTTPATDDKPEVVHTLGAFKPTHFRVLLPTGAKEAVVTLICADGTEQTRTYTSNQNSVDISTICAGAVKSGKVTFKSDPGTFQILNGQSGTFGFTGFMDGTQVAGTPVRNYYKVTADNPVDGGGAFATDGTKAITVTAQTTSVDGKVKTANVKEIIPGQEIIWSMGFRNSGNQALSNAVMVDPSNPAVDSAPWDKLRITGVSNSLSGAVIELWDPAKAGGAGYVAYNANDAALLARAIGIKVTNPTLGTNVTSTTTVKAMLRDGIPVNENVKIKNCMSVSADGKDFGSTCTTGGELNVVPAARGASINKSFPVHSVDRALPGSPAKNVQTRLTAENEGPALLRNFTLEDKGTHKAADETNFFDAVDFQGSSINVNRMVGSTHAKVWVCDFGTGCDANNWVEVSGGTNGFTELSNNNTQTIAFNATKFAPIQRVGGIKVQFATNGAGTGPAVITTDANVGTGTCAGATVCFDVQPRMTLFTDGDQLIPSKLYNGVTGVGQTVALDGMANDTFNVDMADASFELVKGKPQLKLTKTPNGKLNPGGSHEFALTYENTGTGVVTNPKLIDNLPAELDYDAAKSYSITYAAKTGQPTPAPAAPSFTLNPDNPGVKVDKLTWTWSDWTMMPGDKAIVKVNMSLMPGTAGDKQLVNVAGVTAAEFGPAGDPSNPGVIENPCKDSAGVPGTVLGEMDGHTYCKDDAYVETNSGNGFASAKWIAGNADLGFYNSNTKQYVGLNDGACPKLEVDGKVFTRFPCTALVLPGEEFDYTLRLTNMGTNPVNQVRIIDGLPVEGDTGVILDDTRGTDWKNRPVLSSAVTAPERDGMNTTIGYNNDTKACTTSLTSPDASGCDYTDGWSEATGSFQVKLDFADGKLMAPGEYVDLKLKMDSPYDVGDQDDLPIAWNSIAQNVWAVEPGGNVRELRPSEPNMVGVGMLHSQLDVAKIVEDRTGEADVETPFDVAYKCTANDGDFLLEGNGQIVGGQITTLTKKLFPGVECAIWETDARGAVSTATEEDPIKVTMPWFEYGEGENDVPLSVGLGEITNTFEVPPVDPPSGPTEPAVTPTDTPTENPSGSDEPAVTPPTDGDNSEDQGVLPQTGAGLTVMIALLALVLIGAGIALRYASRTRRH